ncbi:MAG TPA: discoidin domain-containing protein [Nitrososphaeraceae archaeon]
MKLIPINLFGLKKGQELHRYGKKQRIAFLFLMTGWLSTVTLLGFSQPSYTQTCANLAIPGSAVTANGNDGNVPQNTVDNNLGTRWSNQPLPSFIQYDLGQSRLVCHVDIAWYRGNERTMTFTISASNDGTTFTNVLGNQQPNTFTSRGTTSLERYDFTDVNARFVRITVLTNTQSNYASITEVDIYAADSSPPPPPPPPPPDSCTQLLLPGSSATASGFESPNTPSNTLDNNLGTRWSNQGLPSFIQYDLGQSRLVCSIDIAWYNGNSRVMTFTISASNDGTTFTNLPPVGSTNTQRMSTGTTTSPERYDFTDVNARFVRITVTGNTANNFASITEVDIYAADSAPPPPPPPPPDGVDPFGIRMIYPTKAGGEQWFMNMANPTSDSRTNPPSMTRNPPGCSTSDPCWRVTSTQVRYNVFTSSGYNPSQITTLDHSELAQKGFMQSPNDWKNVEMTGYVRVINDNSDTENFAWYARGGRHTGDGAPEGCEGSSIKGDLFYNGRVRFAKEQWHVSYVFRPTTTATTDIEGRWVGFKTMMWNTIQSGGRFMQMELWLDRNLDGLQNGPWERVYQTSDTGGFGDEGGECGGAPDQIITWGGPIATFRWDGATDVHIKWFSVREIQPPT